MISNNLGEMWQGLLILKPRKCRPTKSRFLKTLRVANSISTEDILSNMVTKCSTISTLQIWRLVTDFRKS